MSKNSAIERRQEALTEPDAEATEEKFGEFAETYATAREEAAALRGSKTAGQWHQVAQEVEEREEDDRL